MYRKQRDAVVQHWRSLILRETRDLESVEQIAARALHDPDVRDDPEAQSQILAELAERRLEFAELKKARERAEKPDRTSLPRPTSPPTLADPTPPPPEDARAAYDLLTTALSLAFQHNDDIEAESTLARLRELAPRVPNLLPVERITHYEQQVQRLRSRLRHLHDQIELVAQQAVNASRTGDEQAVAQLSKRLSSIHAAYPRLLDEHRLEELRLAIIEASEQHEHQEAARRLVARERAVAAEIKTLAAAVHRFHVIARSAPHDGDAFQLAEKQYQATVKEVRSHDTEWLAGFTIELAELLAEWGNPPRDAQHKVDHFLESVRRSLDRILAEIREIETEEGRSS